MKKILFSLFDSVFYFFYSRIMIPLKSRSIRNKDQIVILFVIHELASWKTENLYLKMLNHNRFKPFLTVVPSLADAEEERHVCSYLSEKKYQFHKMREDESLQSVFHPDIIFYQKPYDRCIPEKYQWNKNLKSLFCFVNYSFRNVPLNQKTRFQKYAWQVYAENSVTAKEMCQLMSNGGRNVLVTGLPVMDELMKDKSSFENPWQKQECEKKKIIYAPYHAVYSPLSWNKSTFMTFGEALLSLAEKYKEETQWAFKPHPLLEPKLVKVWGKEKTKEYYERWKALENCQIETGTYMGLFKHSDAMIHDCRSFMLEYLYTKKPVMFLSIVDNQMDNYTQQTKIAYNAHVIGQTVEDVERFLISIIQNDNKSFATNDKQVDEILLPPNNLSVCDNIINSILGL